MKRITKREILSHKRPISEMPICGYCHCIYLLFDGDEVVYVGQTNWPEERIRSHRRKKTFDAFAVLPTENKDLDTVENSLIAFLKPKGNKVYWSKFVRKSVCTAKSLKGTGKPKPNGGNGRARKTREQLDKEMAEFCVAFHRQVFGE